MVISTKTNINSTFSALGTVNTISVTDFDDAFVIKCAADRVREIHDRFSAFSERSDISAVKKAAGKGFVPVHADTMHVVGKAKAYARLTGGAFNPTFHPLVELWRIGSKSYAIPDASAVQDKLELTNAEDILLDFENQGIMLRRPGQSLDLGGIAKGYAADEVRRILEENGVKEATINLGGTVTVLGSARQVGIQHPDFETGTPMGIVRLSGQASVTSGLYENFFICNGRRYHHLLDPKTGYPSDSGLKSVTLIGSSAMELDALSTALFVLGAEKSRTLIDQFHLEAIFITTDNKVYVTAGLKSSFTIFPHMRSAI